ncbi:heavy-metal-associated domain-containing protein [Ferruginibacter yonginensis]|uniref:Heavy-metal-associated domain-containing protein n=1 Tax=Ferruginibacter yonginensis TaxID=1310416 RepID=A0ABV8QQV1_9BACT
MKLIGMAFLAIFAFKMNVQAQTKVNDKAIISTPTVINDACKDRVEKALFKQYGIISYKVDVKKRTTTVAWITDRTDIEQIKTMIANAGFDAGDVAADPDVYKKLPPICKPAPVTATPPKP